MKNYIYRLLFLFCLPVCGLLCSCSETDDTVEEFPDWQNKNETYFKSLYADAQAKIAAGDTSWKIIRNYSMPTDDMNTEGFSSPYTQKAEDCIVVHVETASNSVNDSPLYNDKVRVHYSGKLLPSTSYADGYVFDKSYEGTFNPKTAIPSELTVNGVVDGFSTALQNMKVGDDWTVYIPYQLGYGSTAQSSIPAYSTLIFNINLVSYYRSDAVVPGYK